MAESVDVVINGFANRKGAERSGQTSRLNGICSKSDCSGGCCGSCGNWSDSSIQSASFTVLTKLESNIRLL